MISDIAPDRHPSSGQFAWESPRGALIEPQPHLRPGPRLARASAWGACPRSTREADRRGSRPGGQVSLTQKLFVTKAAPGVARLGDLNQVTCALASCGRHRGQPWRRRVSDSGQKRREQDGSDVSRSRAPTRGNAAEPIACRDRLRIGSRSSRSGRERSAQGTQVVWTPFDRLNVAGVQKVGSALRYQHWYTRVFPATLLPRMLITKSAPTG